MVNSLNYILIKINLVLGWELYAVISAAQLKLKRAELSGVRELTKATGRK